MEKEIEVVDMDKLNRTEANTLLAYPLTEGYLKKNKMISKLDIIMHNQVQIFKQQKSMIKRLKRIEDKLTN